MGIRMTNIATPMPQPRAKFTNKLGLPLSGGKVYTYEPGTDIPKKTWRDVDKSVENTNPIQLDAAGEADIYGVGFYRVLVKDFFGLTIYDVEKTGIAVELDASFVFDGDKNQHQINEEQKAQNNSFKSKIRKTPYDFGAKGGDNDDTQAVIDCISTGYFLIDAEYTVKPFLIQDLKLNGEFNRNGKLKIIDAQGRDSVEFRECSGFIDGFTVEETYTSGIYATVLANQCKDFDLNWLRVDGGKIMTVVLKDCDNSYVNVGVGIGTGNQQGWYLVGSRNSEFRTCRLNNGYSAGFFIIGPGYKSGTNHMTTRPTLEATGMRTRWCSSGARGTGFDINGAVGAGFYDCDADQDGIATQSSGFQVKQSTNIPEETKRLTYNNEIVNCTSRNCARGFNTQNGQDVVMRNITVVNCKNDAVILNDTPRVTVDGLTVIDFAQQNNTAKSSATDQISSVVNFTNSTRCSVKGVRVVQNNPVEDRTKARIFNNEGSNNSIEDVRISTSVAVDVAGVQFVNYVKNTGLHFNFGDGLKIGATALYSTVIDDQTSTAIYPLVFSKQINLAGATSDTEYFDEIPERGLIVGKVRFSVIGTPANSKIGVGDQSSVVRTLGLTDVVVGVNDYTPSNQIIAQSLALAIRREIAGTGAGRVFVQMRGISLF